MSADTVVFLGPSLPRDEAALLLPRAEFLPPVRRGDVLALLARDVPPAAVGIVDGCFLHAMCISPKEVLVAIDRGVALYGSSSMGALRAAELDTMGMTGVGRVYEMYRDGEVDADDEVAITFDPDSLRALCVPMVNVRVATAALVETGIVDRATGSVVLRVAKSLYFPDRTYENVLTLVERELGEGTTGRLRAAYREVAPDAKAEDAKALLRSLRKRTSNGDGDRARAGALT